MKVISEKLYWVLWTIRKVRSRDPLYLPRRVSYTIKRFIVDRAFPLNCRNDMSLFESHIPTSPGAFLDYFQKRRTPRFHFEPEEIALIDEIIGVFWNQTAVEVSDLSHRLPSWITKEIGEDIPYEAVFIDRRELTPAEEEWAAEIAERANG